MVSLINGTLRKAIGKKVREILAKMKVDFIEGGVKTVGATPEMMGIFGGN